MVPEFKKNVEMNEWLTELTCLSRNCNYEPGVMQVGNKLRQGARTGCHQLGKPFNEDDG